MFASMAAVTSLASHPRVIIGTASPALTAADLQRAARSLDRHHDAVVIPAADAGYVLVGLKRCDARLFGDIAWGGKDVMATTRERLAVLGWRWYELPSSWDVDRPTGYQRLVASGIIPDFEQALGGLERVSK